MVKLKISSVKTKEDIYSVNEIQPHYAGLVFYDSINRVTGNIASHLVFDLRPEIDTVGMFRDHEAGEITGLLSAGIIDVVELCGNESEQFISNLKLRAEAKVIKHFTLSQQSDVLAINATTADFVSLKESDLNSLAQAKKLITKPIIIRMDKTPESVAILAKELCAYAVDIADDKGKLNKQAACELLKLINQ